MAHPSDVEAEIALRHVVVEHGDEGAGIGMPVGELAEEMLDMRSVDLAGFELGHLGFGVGEILSGRKPAPGGERIDGDDAHRRVLLLPKDQRLNELRLSPLETIGSPAGQAQDEMAPAAALQELLLHRRVRQQRSHYQPNPE